MKAGNDNPEKDRPEETGEGSAYGPWHFLIYGARDLFLAFLFSFSALITVELARPSSADFYLNLNMLVIGLCVAGMISFFWFSREDGRAGLPAFLRVSVGQKQVALLVVLGVFLAAVIYVTAIRQGSPAFMLTTAAGFVIVTAFTLSK